MLIAAPINSPSQAVSESVYPSANEINIVKSEESIGGLLGNPALDRLQSASRGSLEDYFESWSETRSEWIEGSMGTGYWLYSKRSVASSVGYTGSHYLRAYIGGVYQSSTDTGRVYRNVGFTLKSGWAYSPYIAVPATAYAFYGY